MGDVKQVIRQLRIQTGACKRLTNDLKMYIEEKNDYIKRLKSLEDSKADKYKIKTQRELLEETCAVLLDTYGKAKEAYAKLDKMMVSITNGGEETIQNSEEAKKAAAQLITTHGVLNPKKKQSVSQTSNNSNSDVDLKEGDFAKSRTVSVFGSSGLKEDSPIYAMAVKVGEALAKKGFHIMNGGYMGLMEATTKGARKVEGAKIRGVLVPKAFPMRKGGNKYLTHKLEEDTIEERLATLVGKASAFVVLPGSLGTLTELVMAWNTAVLAPLAGQNPPPIIAFKDPWEDILKGVQAKLKIPEQMLQMVQFVSSAEEAIETISKLS
mmetsp:Transcript_25289/g.40566  ORF Transcript_25289/g.40566 Transcript_25289/m.40566 type:complete len:324 (-) Transcript_25289:331-1302(-)